MIPADQWGFIDRHTWEAIDFFANQIALLCIVIVLMLKALAFRRGTSLGQGLFVFGAAFAFVYMTIFLRPWVEFFQTAMWTWIIRMIILCTSLKLLWELKVFFGGWKELWEQICISMSELLHLDKIKFNGILKRNPSIVRIFRRGDSDEETS